MKVAIYCRVSTDDKGQNPKVQLDRCREYCQQNNHQIIAEFLDEGVSGDTNYYDRPEGAKLEKCLFSGRVKGIVCFSIDRFSRQNPLKILPMLKEMTDSNIKFISVTESVFNMESDVAEPMRYMLSWFSHYFLKQHTIKVVEGIRRAQREGTKTGNQIGRKRAADYDKIQRLSKAGYKISEIAKKTGYNKSSVWYALKSKEGLI